jgi:toxin HigB-1
MIRSFRHKGLQRLFRDQDYRGVPRQFVPRLERMLDRLDTAVRPEDMNLPGYGFHELKGNRSATYSTTVSRNWRLTFRFTEGNASHVDLEDYH